MNFRIVRHKQTDFATYATLFSEKKERLGVILERPFVDADNDGRRDPNVCRIQHGRYRAIRRISPKRGYPVWWLCDVPDVSSAHFPDEPTATTCQLHRANFPWDLRGCIGIGTAFGDIEYKGDSMLEDPINREKGKRYPGIVGSVAAFERFMEQTAGVWEIWFDIIDNFGAPAGTWA